MILLILLSYFLLNYSETPLLPESPGVVVPVDAEDIGMDDDSLVTIVTDRLNIALYGEKWDLK